MPSNLWTNVILRDVCYPEDFSRYQSEQIKLLKITKHSTLLKFFESQIFIDFLGHCVDVLFLLCAPSDCASNNIKINLISSANLSEFEMPISWGKTDKIKGRLLFHTRSVRHNRRKHFLIHFLVGANRFEISTKCLKKLCTVLVA